MLPSTQSTMFSSASGVHNTPADVIERARAVLRGIDLDPASSAAANCIVRARRFYADPYTPDHTVDATAVACAGFDGLAAAHDWVSARSLWLNAPFSVDKRDEAGNIVLNASNKPIRQRVIDRWVAKWRASVPAPNGRYEARPDGMLLVPARVDTLWFAPLWGYAMCFVSGRLTFSEAENSAPFPTVIVYAGAATALFYELFSDIGECGKFAR